MGDDIANCCAAGARARCGTTLPPGAGFEIVPVAELAAADRRGGRISVSSGTPSRRGAVLERRDRRGGPASDESDETTTFAATSAGIWKNNGDEPGQHADLRSKPGGAYGAACCR